MLKIVIIIIEHRYISCYIIELKGDFMSKKFKINRMPFIFFLGLLILAIFYALYVEISFAGENSEYFAYS